MAPGEGSRVAAGLLLLIACDSAFLPLRGRIDVGREPMVIFVGGESRAGGDIYAVSAAGGPAIAITFSAVGEMRPALSPDGLRVAFLRGSSLADSAPGSAWVMDLTDGVEQRIELPRGVGPPDQVGWADRGRWLVVRAGGLYRVEARSDGTARPVAAAERAAAESALAVIVGDPPFARAVPCADPDDLCVVGESGAPMPFAPGAREPARWGGDSVAYLEGDRLLVRPVGAGRARRVEWSGLPARPRQPTVFAGATTPAPR